MIGVIFEYGSEKITVVIDKTNCYFRNNKTNSVATIEGLKLDKKGVLKEFPDLKDKSDWKSETIKRFKAKMKSFETERERIQYVINDLTKYGYNPLYLMERGKRPIKLKNKI